MMEYLFQPEYPLSGILGTNGLAAGLGTGFGA
jgi:hypothetical protein